MPYVINRNGALVWHGDPQPDPTEVEQPLPPPGPPVVEEPPVINPEEEVVEKKATKKAAK